MPDKTTSGPASPVASGTPDLIYRAGENLSAQHGEIVIDGEVVDTKLATLIVYGTDDEVDEAEAFLAARLAARRQALAAGDTDSYASTFETTWSTSR